MEKERITNDDIVIALHALEIELKPHDVRPVLEELRRANDITLEGTELRGDALKALQKLWRRQVLAGDSNTVSDIQNIIDRIYDKVKADDAY